MKKNCDHQNDDLGPVSNMRAVVPKCVSFSWKKHRGIPMKRAMRNHVELPVPSGYD